MELSALPVVLERLVLERLDDGRFLSRGELPAWSRRLPALEKRLAGPFVLEEAFPSLRDFLSRAEEVWTDGAARASSEFWTEVDREGRKLHLQSHALFVTGDPVLLVTHDEGRYREQQLLLQRASELRAAHDELLSAMERQDILLHVIVDEFADALRPLLASLHLLRECARTPRERALVHRAQAWAHREERIIGDLLEVFSAWRAPTSSIPDDWSELRAAFERAIDELAAPARARGIFFVLRDETDEPFIRADERRLGRLLMNLLRRAVGNSPPEGEIRITMTYEGSWIRVAIEDEGPLLSRELRAVLTDQLTVHEDHESTLQLYFCRITAERFGGALGYEATERGPRFVLRFPSRSADSTHDPSPSYA